MLYGQMAIEMEDNRVAPEAPPFCSLLGVVCCANKGGAWGHFGHHYAGDIRDLGSITGLERSPGGGHSNPLEHSCLENPMDRGAWWATIHRVAKSQIQMK